MGKGTNQSMVDNREELKTKISKSKSTKYVLILAFILCGSISTFLGIKLSHMSISNKVSIDVDGTVTKVSQKDMETDLADAVTTALVEEADTKLLELFYEEKGIEVSDKEVDSAFENYVNNYYGGQENYDSITEIFLGKDEYFKRKLKLTIAESKYLEELAGSEQVSAMEVEDYFNEASESYKHVDLDIYMFESEEARAEEVARIDGNWAKANTSSDNFFADQKVALTDSGFDIDLAKVKKGKIYECKINGTYSLIRVNAVNNTLDSCYDLVEQDLMYLSAQDTLSNELANFYSKTKVYINDKEISYNELGVSQ